MIDREKKNGSGNRISAIAWHLASLAGDQRTCRKLLPTVLVVCFAAIAAGFILSSEPPSPTGQPDIDGAEVNMAAAAA